MGEDAHGAPRKWKSTWATHWPLSLATVICDVAGNRRIGSLNSRGESRWQSAQAGVAPGACHRQVSDMIDAPSALQSSLADRYRIDREIGVGGMAIVYLAHDLCHDGAVALKVLRPDMAAAVGVERFRREVAITATLQHPHILPRFDSGEAAGQLYYVTPYVDVEERRSHSSVGSTGLTLVAAAE